MQMAEILILRHAPTVDGRIAGRRDVAAVRPAPALAARIAALAGPVSRLIASPALRCRTTAAAVFPGLPMTTDTRLWEQDLGAWEGAAPQDLPDLGPLSGADLARHRPPGGESFADLCARAAPALTEAAAGPGRVVIVAHAGIVRVALALAIGAPGPALAFEVAPLSLTLLRASPGPVGPLEAGSEPVGSGQIWAVGFVNRVAG